MIRLASFGAKLTSLAASTLLLTSLRFGDSESQQVTRPRISETQIELSVSTERHASEEKISHCSTQTISSSEKSFAN